MNKAKLFLMLVTAIIIGGLIAGFVLMIYYNRTVWSIWFVFICVILIDACFAIYIINSKRHMNTKACWLLLIAILPLAGCLFFVIFGTMPMSRKDWRLEMLSNAKLNKYENYDYSKSFINSNSDASSLFSYSYRNELKPVYKNNRVDILTSNTKSYSEIIRLIRSAKDFIHMETYILHDGFFLRTVFAELILRAKSGIKVRLLYDWYGGWHKFKRKQIRELKAAGIEVGVFNQPGFNMFKSATNYRLHRKSIIVDNKYAFYGGSNIGDEYLSVDPKKYYWRDQNFIFEGEIVNSLNIVFINDWLNFTDRSIAEENKRELSNNLNKYLKMHSVPGDGNMQLCTNAPNYEEKGIMNNMATMMLRAKKSIKLITPYFLPTELCLSALKIAARSGVDVKIILPGKRDNKNFILTANRGQYSELLKVWCKVYEYDGFIHSKCLIVDDKYVLTTSANFDFRSFWSDFEDGILSDSPSFSKKMCESFEKEISNSKLITREKVKQFNTLSNKLKLSFLNLYKPLL